MTIPGDPILEKVKSEPSVNDLQNPFDNDYVSDIYFTCFEIIIHIELNENLPIHDQSWILSAQLYYCIHLRYKFFKFFSYFELRAESLSDSYIILNKVS